MPVKLNCFFLQITEVTKFYDKRSPGAQHVECSLRVWKVGGSFVKD